MGDDLLGDQFVTGGGEMDAVDAAQTLRNPETVLAVGGVIAGIVGEDCP